MTSSTVGQLTGTFSNTRIDRARIPGFRDLQQVWVNPQGTIEAIQPMGSRENLVGVKTLDFAGDWLSLGGVDLQINGALGLAFPDLTPGHEQQLQDICDFLWQQGVDGFLPTIVTTSVENIHRSLAVLGQFAEEPRQATAEILGVHLEGPFLNPKKRGAHPAEYLQPLTRQTVEHVLGPYASHIKVMTLAPELDSTGTAIAHLRTQNIIVSLGHSLATADQAQAAFDQGATMVTHAFNTMPGLHHRRPGLLAAALLHPDVWCGLIADGQHVDPLMLKLLLQTKPRQGLFLVSDALAPLGLSDGMYSWDNRQIEVKGDTARLANGTLAGTTLPLLAGVQNLVRWDACSIGQAIALATDAPRRALGLPGLSPGSQASTLLRWHYDNDIGELSWQRLM